MIKRKLVNSFFSLICHPRQSVLLGCNHNFLINLSDRGCDQPEFVVKMANGDKNNNNNCRHENEEVENFNRFSCFHTNAPRTVRRPGFERDRSKLSLITLSQQAVFIASLPFVSTIRPIRPVRLIVSLRLSFSSIVLLTEEVKKMLSPLIHSPGFCPRVAERCSPLVPNSMKAINLSSFTSRACKQQRRFRQLLLILSPG